jgi:Fe-S-cluster containining protein
MKRKWSRSKLRAKARWSEQHARMPAVGDGRGFDLTQALLSDLSEITLDVTEEMVGVSLQLPIGNHEAFADYQEVLDLDDTPDYLRSAAKAFANAVLRAVRERQLLQRPVPCSTCLSTCCRNADIPVSGSDVARMEEAGIDVSEKTLLFYPTESLAGHIAEFVLIPAPSVLGDDASQDDLVCPHLRSDGCGIYEHRPTICREYSAWTCDSYAEDPQKRDGVVRLRVVQ